ncbi:uncharacterized protein LOC127260777 [Andrographis paniculata]|uniref:uncharacterized protein LOC127260777 n=1 Tax=Andrographis paniculata TaxID=175694 RepID=UPI0021E7003D|nr:uncharacterized protein LOC127260777 [Andrographis paniculata]
MGKVDDQPLPVVQQQNPGTSAGRRCSVDVSRFISLKCAAVLMLSYAAFVLALVWALPIRYRHLGFEAKESVKHSATVQAYFRLNKPVSELIPYIKRLEYDLNGELGVPSSKVAVLSMRPEGKSKWTDVVFGFLPNSYNSEIDPVPLSLLKLSLIDLFLRQVNLTVDYSFFGDPSTFQILKFPDGVTIIPEQAAVILQTHPVLFRFTLNSSIYDIRKNLQDLKKQLKLGLHLMPNEGVYIKVTNKIGSTIDAPVSVEASVVSDLGFLSQERLKQLAHILTGPARNLGLDHYVFGKVKGIRLSSYLKHSLHSPSPTPSPSPAPSPEQIGGCSPSPLPSSPSPQNQPHHSSPPIGNLPKSSVAHNSRHCGSSDPPRLPPAGLTHEILPIPPPLPGATYDSWGQERSRKYLVSRNHVLPSISSSRSCNGRIGWVNNMLIGVAAVVVPFLLI